MLELKTYNKNGQKLRAVIDHKWMPYYAAEDLLSILGTKGKEKVLASLDKDEKVLVASSTVKVLMVNQSGFYRLVHLSQSKNIPMVKDWVGEINKDLSALQRMRDVFDKAHQRRPEYFESICAKLISETNKRESAERTYSSLLGLSATAGRYGQEAPLDICSVNVRHQIAHHCAAESLAFSALQAELAVTEDIIKSELSINK